MGNITETQITEILNISSGRDAHCALLAIGAIEIPAKGNPSYPNRGSCPHCGLPIESVRATGTPFNWVISCMVHGLRNPECAERERVAAERRRQNELVARRWVMMHSHGVLVARQISGAEAATTKRRKFLTEDACDRAINAMQSRCDHEWRWQSHEEQCCDKCGAIKFVPDYNNDNWAGANGEFTDQYGERAE